MGHEILLKHTSYEPQVSGERYRWKAKDSHRSRDCSIFPTIGKESPQTVQDFDQCWVQFQNFKSDPFQRITPVDSPLRNVASNLPRKVRRRKVKRPNHLRKTVSALISESELDECSNVDTIYSPKLVDTPPNTPPRIMEQNLRNSPPAPPQKLKKPEKQPDIDEISGAFGILSLVTDVPSPERRSIALTNKRLRMSPRTHKRDIWSVALETNAQELCQVSIPLIKTPRLSNPDFCGQMDWDDSSSEGMIATVDSSDESSDYSNQAPVANHILEEKFSFRDKWYYGSLNICRGLWQERHGSFDDHDSSTFSSAKRSRSKKRVRFDSKGPTVFGQTPPVVTRKKSLQEIRMKLRIDEYDSPKFAEMLKKMKGNKYLRELDICRATTVAKRTRSIQELLSLFSVLETLPCLEHLYFQDFKATELELVPLEALLEKNPSLSSLKIGTASSGL